MRFSDTDGVCMIRTERSGKEGGAAPEVEAADEKL